MEITKQYIQRLSYKVIGCAIEVHKEIGPGLLESIYGDFLIHELERKGLKVHAQLPVPVFYKGKQAKHPLRLDLLVEDLIIVENKAVESFVPVHKAALLTYMKLSQKPKGLLFNFHVDNLTENGLISLVMNILKRFLMKKFLVQISDKLLKNLRGTLWIPCLRG